MNKQIRVGINGLGRIGRQIYKLCVDDPNISLIGINELNPDINNWAYTLNYDSIYGKPKYTTLVRDSLLICNKEEIFTSHHNDILNVPWNIWGVDILIDSSGVYKNINSCKEILKLNHCKKIFITNSPSNLDFEMVLGVNNELYDHKKHNLISSSICDATAIAPITKLINDIYKIKNGYVTTLHPWLNYQNLMDGPSISWSYPGEVYHHYALGRSAVGNMIPKPTSAMDAVFKVIPDLNHKNIGSFSYRTPTQIVGSADITYIVEKKINKNELLEYFLKFEKEQKFPILKISDEPLVSMDYIKEESSAILDKRWLDVIDNELIKIILWYDNEFGYSSNVIKQLKFINSFF